MDMYGLDSARAQGNAMTKDNALYNENILSARDRINNALDSQKITAEGNARGQASTDLQDKVIYSVKDAISGATGVGSVGRFGESAAAFNRAKGAGLGNLSAAYRSQRALARGDVDKTFGPATQVGDKAIAPVATKTVAGVNMIQTDREVSAGGLRGALGRTKTQSVFLPDRGQFPAGNARGASIPDSQRSVLVGGPTDVPDDPPTAPAGAPATSAAPAAPAPAATPASRVNNRARTNEPAASNANTPKVTDTKLSATDELSNRVLTTTDKIKKGAGIASTGLRTVGDIGGAIGTYEMFKNGFTKNASGGTDRLNEVSQIAGAVGTGLDIVGAFIPALEPIGQLAQVVGAVADTIDQHEKDDADTTAANKSVTDVAGTKASELAALPKLRAQNAPVNTMVSSGLVGSQSQHIATATTGSGAF